MAYQRRLAWWPVLAAMVVAGCGQTGGVENRMNGSELRLNCRIFSTPVIWPIAGSGYALAMIGGDDVEGGAKATAVYAFRADGSRVPGFPRMRRAPYLVAPSNQVGAGDLVGEGRVELLVVDVDGRLNSLEQGSDAPRATADADPVRAVLASPPVVLRPRAGGGPALLMVGRGFSPHANSRDAVDLADMHGRSLSGYPVTLRGTPEMQPAVADLGTGRLHVLLETGQVEGLDLRTGQRLPGFPATFPHGAMPKFGYRMVMYPPWSALIVTSGAGQLHRIDPAAGKVVGVNVGASRVTGTAAAADRLYAVDEVGQRLIRVAPAVSVMSSLALNVQPDFLNYYVDGAVLPNASGAYIVAAFSRETDPDKRVEPVFEEYATPEIREQIRRLAEVEALNEFHTLDLNRDQQKEVDHSVRMMKRGYLQRRLGWEKTAALLAGEAEVQIRVVFDDGVAMRLVLEDSIKGYAPETGAGMSPIVYPVLHVQRDRVTLCVPANAERSQAGDEVYRAVVRIYELQR